MLLFFRFIIFQRINEYEQVFYVVVDGKEDTTHIHNLADYIYNNKN